MASMTMLSREFKNNLLGHYRTDENLRDSLLGRDRADCEFREFQSSGFTLAMTGLAEGLHVTTVVKTGQARNSQVGANTVLSSRA